MLELQVILTVLDTAKTTGKLNYLKETDMTVKSISQRLEEAGFSEEHTEERNNLASDLLVQAHLKHMIGILQFNEMPTMTVIFHKIFQNPTIHFPCSESSYNDALEETKKNILRYL